MAGPTSVGRVRSSSAGGGGKRAGGRYVLGELLGRGGMAEVFAGYVMGDHGFQKPVAIKRLLPELAVDLVFVDRLIEEAKLLVGMQHGNIVSVLDLARDGDDVFLVMEFVDGPSLRQLIKARGTRGIPPAIATYVVQTASQGLEFAHSRPGGAIIHADISPSNLLLTTSGEVRVADFGIARREGGGHGVVEGKWAYMAPEQARGEPLDPRSDVFAMGVVLYELFTGAHPFGRQVTHEERDSEPMRVIPPRQVKPSLPAGLEAICMKALAHERRDRYPRMQALIDAIVEERFANHYREGASDLAATIREANPTGAGPQPGNPRTMLTDRPVTIMTRSLLRELTPPHGSSRSRSRSASDPQPAREPQPGPSAPAVRPPPPRLESFDEPLSTYEQPSELRSRSHSRSPARSRPVAPEPEHEPEPEPDSEEVSHHSGAQTMAIETEGVSRAAAAADPALGAPASVLASAPAGPNPTFTPEQIAAAKALLAQQHAARAAAEMLAQIPPQLRSAGPAMPQWLPPTPPEPADPSFQRAVAVPAAAAPAVGPAASRPHRLLYSVLLAIAILGVVVVAAIKLMPHDELPPAIDETPRWVNGAPPPREAIELAAGAGSFTIPPASAPDAAAAEVTVPVVAVIPIDAAEPEAASPDAADVVAVEPDAAPPDPIVPDAATTDVTAPPTNGTGRPRPPTTPRKKDPGYLRVEMSPAGWAEVNGERQSAPGARFALPPGTYRVKLIQSVSKRVAYKSVTIESGKTVKLPMIWSADEPEGNDDDDRAPRPRRRVRVDTGDDDGAQ